VADETAEEKIRRLEALLAAVAPITTRKNKSKKPTFAWKAAKHKNWASHVDVLKAVREWAFDLQTQRTIAANLGKILKTFEMAMSANKGDNALRLAWESGHAEAEQIQLDEWKKCKPSDKNPVAWIFGMKNNFDWQDKRTVDINNSERITLVLPGSYAPTEEGERAYMAAIGQEAIIDSRPLDKRGPVGGMKDVSPESSGVGADGKLAVLGVAKQAV
jgi:hypothetical protein